MTIVTVRLDERLKSKMKRLRHVNWSEVIRAAIAERIWLEESIAARRSINLDLLQKAITDQDRLRAKSSGVWSGAEEVRKWRELRK
jgi:Arc/MetJ-type ribon-helix-helix transcriptional regulator